MSSHITKCLSGPPVHINLSVMGRTARFYEAVAPSLLEEESSVSEEVKTVFLNIIIYITSKEECSENFDVQKCIDALEKVYAWVNAVSIAASKRSTGCLIFVLFVVNS